MSVVVATQPTVLLVEDNADLRSTLADIFELSGIPVVTASHGRAALEYLEWASAPALIITDLMMPVMDGWDLCAWLRANPRFAAMPVVVCSALPEVYTRVKELAPTAYFEKPLDLNRLLDLVRGYCAA